MRLLDFRMPRPVDQPRREPDLAPRKRSSPEYQTMSGSCPDTAALACRVTVDTTVS